MCNSFGYPGKSPAWTAGFSLTVVNGLLLPGQGHLIAQKPELAPHEHPRTAQPFSRNQKGLVFTEVWVALSAVGPELLPVATFVASQSKEDGRVN